MKLYKYLLIFCFFSLSAAEYECLRCCERECGPYIVLAVEARGLDYSAGGALIRTMAKHPRGGSKNSDVGHAWIYMRRGDEVIFGGHSAERGVLQPRYIEGVCLLAEKGDPNPARYLFKNQRDGFFEAGAGGHTATFAVKIPISASDFETVARLLKNYPWEEYALSGRSCVTLVAEIAEKLGYPLEYKQIIYLAPVLTMGGDSLTLWEDPRYSKMTIASPERLQESLKKLVSEGHAQACTKWLRRQHPEPFLAA